MSAASALSCLFTSSELWIKANSSIHPFGCQFQQARKQKIREGAHRLVKALSSEAAESNDGAEESKAQQIGKASALAEGPTRSLNRKGTASGFGTVPVRPKDSASKRSKAKNKPALNVQGELQSEKTDKVSVLKNSGVIRRASPKKPLIEAQIDETAQQIETVAVISLFALFAVIIVEGLALAAAGFLPEDWDAFLLKAIYPSYTPTVAVFFAGAITYGLFKYLGGETKK
ncbi:hypothetical protein O6H91_12G106000 [Diphasiastrum complanatum]|uniref:Uncharacterized protein n=4 Tax=Diphasiastrum complanatum TaxID=34168 RepID=A0ACC2C5D1_DIPCM|nr:hypothetical protein O6H91_12G105100 [Diphasiastrum complanatum]KAJ7537252.1 hypothetical protein O6H91_12G105100 [Diphasiastrum complanatum]KAJ7537253.1 hypothetical protein O6H91_12G105100 [Diphasiastrum complanatum]KAJ7537279.1 hypothetical protein O6H91_12G106000 [Diphasiastrum complanatum]